MSSGETSSKKRNAETIHVAGSPSAKRAKRLRVSLACAECRRKKERCDGNQPVCGSCKSQDRDCSYVPRPKKRGLATGYVRGLEILLGLIFHSVEGCQHSVVAILKGESAIPDPGGREEDTASTVNVLVDAWRNSASWKELDRILSTAESEEDEELSARHLHERLDEALKKSLSIKGEAATSPILCAASPPDSQAVILEHGIPSIAVDSAQEDRRISAKQSGVIENPSGDIPTGRPSTSSLPQDWSQLLDIYFSNTNCWIPIVLRNEVFRVAYTLSTESNDNNANQLALGDQACILSLLAYAKYTQCVIIGKNGFRQDLQDQFAKLFAQASQLITTYDSQRDVGHIQAMLVFTLLHYAQGNSGLAWSFVGRAVYHAVELGLLKSGATHPRTLDNRSKRVVLSCFVLETLLAARLHRRPYMRTSDVRSVGSLDADGIEEWEPWRPTGLSSYASACDPRLLSHQPARILSTFNQLVQTSTLLNDKLQYHPDDTDKKAPQGHLDTLRFLQLQDSLQSLLAQSEPHSASPQALNLMLATLASLLRLDSPGSDAGDRNQSSSSTITIDAHRALARVAEGVKQQGAITLSPLSDVYLHIIENRNSTATSSFSREALGSISAAREIRARYDETWRNTNLGPRAPGASAPLQPEGLICSRGAPPHPAQTVGGSWSPLMAPLPMTGSSDLFSSLVSLDNDDSRPILSQEFVGNLGVLGDFSMDPVEFQNLFTG